MLVQKHREREEKRDNQRLDLGSSVETPSSSAAILGRNQWQTPGKQTQDLEHVQNSIQIYVVWPAGAASSSGNS